VDSLDLSRKVAAIGLHERSPVGKERGDRTA
jgi:hypothetical protein